MQRYERQQLALRVLRGGMGIWGFPELRGACVPSMGVHGGGQGRWKQWLWGLCLQESFLLSS